MASTFIRFATMAEMQTELDNLALSDLNHFDATIVQEGSHWQPAVIVWQVKSDKQIVLRLNAMNNESLHLRRVSANDAARQMIDTAKKMVTK